MSSEIVLMERKRYVLYNNRFYKERTELLKTCLTETNNRIRAFQKIRPKLEAYLSNRIGGQIELELDGSIREGTCNTQSDIDVRIQFPATRSHESHVQEINKIINFYDQWENGQV